MPFCVDMWWRLESNWECDCESFMRETGRKERMRLLCCGIIMDLIQLIY